MIPTTVTHSNLSFTKYIHRALCTHQHFSVKICHHNHPNILPFSNTLLPTGVGCCCMPVILVCSDTKGWCGSADSQRSCVTDLVTSWSEGAPSQGARLVSVGCLLLSSHQLVVLQTPSLTSIFLFPQGIHNGCLMGLLIQLFTFNLNKKTQKTLTLLCMTPRWKQRKYTPSPACANVGIPFSFCCEPGLWLLPPSS